MTTFCTDDFVMKISLRHLLYYRFWAIKYLLLIGGIIGAFFIPGMFWRETFIYNHALSTTECNRLIVQYIVSSRCSAPKTPVITFIAFFAHY